MPTVTYLGPYMWRRRSDTHGTWERNQPVKVSQEWLNHWRARLSLRDFSIEGDAGVTVDFGTPDAGWTKKDIGAWLKEKGAVVGGYNTKSKLLDMVKTTLNPPAPEPVVEEALVEEALVEETIIEDPMDETLGVEE